MSEITEVSPRKLQEAVTRGFKRLANFRAARIHFLRENCGSYYDRTSGEIGTAPMNLIFNAVRILLPTMVMSFPKHSVMTPYLQAREYANLLGLALDQHDMKINIRDTYRRVIVDAMFSLGTLKSGLAQSDSVYALDDDEDQIDPGTVYTEVVDFDNLVVDPASQEHLFRDAKFIGDRLTVPRKLLLDSKLYKNELIERLPRADDVNKQRRAYAISMNGIQPDENAEMEDLVEIVELWIPSANAIVTVPGDEDAGPFDDYLRVSDYYGVKEGPYTFLALTPPVPGNPLPVPMVGIWYDLHVLANRMAKKIVEQAERQKDIVAYKRSSSDDAVELKNAGDGEAVAVDDPDGVKTLNFGGQQPSNEGALASLQSWFNMMAGNPEQIGGQAVQGKSATAANILQQNASISLEDAKDLVYQMAASEARKRAWYFHTDPLMKIPLTRRQVQPGQPMMRPDGTSFMTPPTMEEIQVILTPEARRGDYLDFTFNIEPESMGRRDSKLRLQQAMAFATQIVPAVSAAAVAMAQLQLPFSAKAMLLRMAKDSGIEWMDEVFYDPEFQMHMQQQMMMGPQPGPSKGQLAGKPNAGGGLMDQVLQNHQPAAVQGAPQGSPTNPAIAQEGANEAQRLIRMGLTHSLEKGAAPKPMLANANAF